MTIKIWLDYSVLSCSIKCDIQISDLWYLTTVGIDGLVIRNLGYCHKSNSSFVNVIAVFLSMDLRIHITFYNLTFKLKEEISLVKHT